MYLLPSIRIREDSMKLALHATRLQVASRRTDAEGRERPRLVLRVARPRRRRAQVVRRQRDVRVPLDLTIRELLY